MSDLDTETPIAARAAEIRRRLASCFDADAAMAALSYADLATLRELEPEYTFRPWPVTVLREKIAQAHVRMVRGKVLMSTQAVTTDVVRRWAETTLGEWFAGYTDFEETLGGQFRIRLLEPEPEHPDTLHAEIVTANGHDPRRFLLTVTVTDAP